MEANSYVVLANSASKRALFPSSRKENESDKDSIGCMSPLCMSSPDRYSSPPPSPQMLSSPLKDNDIFPLKSKDPRLSRHDFWQLNGICVTPLKSDQAVGLIKSPRIARKPLHDSNDIQQTVLNMDLVDETPEKESHAEGLMTPFRCLASKGITTNGHKIMETPDVASVRKTIFTPLKDFQKNNHNCHSSEIKTDTLLKPKPRLDLDSELPTIHEITQKSFYKPAPKARTSLFPERKPLPVLAAKRKRARSPSVTTTRTMSNLYHRLGGGSRTLKRRKAGEINSGVYHKIKPPKPKKMQPIKLPMITPKARVEEYLLKKINDTPSTTVDQLMEVVQPSCSVSVAIETTPKKSPPVRKSVPSPPADPSKKFFKTNRTLAINRKATVTVVDCMKIQVSNGKFSLENTAKKQKSCTKSVPNNKVKVPQTNENGFEDMVVEPVPDTVKQSVQSILESLDEDTVEEEIPNQLPTSPVGNITSITASTSSLAIDDGVAQELPEVQPVPLVSNVDCSSTVVIPGGKESNKLYPVFYKNENGSPNIDNKAVTPVHRKISGSAKKWKPIGNDQYQIDAGQKRFGATQCKECGIVYQLGDPEDEISHYNFHNNAQSLKFMGWAEERVVKEYSNGRVIVVYPDDSKRKLKKAREVLEVVDRELGFVDTVFKYLEYSKVYFFVNNKRVVGCLVAEPKTEAFKMLSVGTEGVDCCSLESYPVKCGVNRIWTVQDQRRNKVATHLMDCLRLSFMFAHVLRKEEIAFSVPTLEGKVFAEMYTGTPNFLVYN